MPAQRRPTPADGGLALAGGFGRRRAGDKRTAEPGRWSRPDRTGPTEEVPVFKPAVHAGGAPFQQPAKVVDPKRDLILTKIKRVAWCSGAAPRAAGFRLSRAAPGNSSTMLKGHT